MQNFSFRGRRYVVADHLTIPRFNQWALILNISSDPPNLDPTPPENKNANKYIWWFLL